jgi:hypothetical protein
MEETVKNDPKTPTPKQRPTDKISCGILMDITISITNSTPSTISRQLGLLGNVTYTFFPAGSLLLSDI